MKFFPPIATVGGAASWADVTGKPSTFPPTVPIAQADITGLVSDLDGKQASGSYAAASHSHAIADTTGLQAAIDGKAATSHTHTASQISDSTTAGRGMLTAADVAAQTALLNAVTSGAKGLAPASGGGTTNFLRADGTWTAPAGGASYNYCQLTANYTLTSQTAAQKLFNASANGALTLDTGRYLFRSRIYLLSMSATSGNGAFNLKGSGTATLANILFTIDGVDNTSPLSAAARGGSASVTAASVASMVTAGTGTGLVAMIEGIFNVTVGGTIIPSIALVTAAAAIVQAGSYFECIRIGDTGANTLGAWS